MDLQDRDLRQRDLVPPERLAACHATVVGVGAIGRQVALQLAAMGVPRLQLVDPDIVEVVNLACQGYLEADLGRPKVEATARLCRQLNSQIELQAICERFRRSLEVGSVLFCCVDRIDTRRRIWEATCDTVSAYFDARMAAESVRILSVTDYRSRAHYPTTLFGPEQAYRGACTARATLYAASIAAGWMVALFSRWLRRLPLEADLYVNLLAAELTVSA